MKEFHPHLTHKDNLRLHIERLTPNVREFFKYEQGLKNQLLSEHEKEHLSLEKIHLLGRLNELEKKELHDFRKFMKKML